MSNRVHVLFYQCPYAEFDQIRFVFRFIQFLFARMVAFIVPMALWSNPIEGVIVTFV